MAALRRETDAPFAEYEAAQNALDTQERYNESKAELEQAARELAKNLLVESSAERLLEAVAQFKSIENADMSCDAYALALRVYEDYRFFDSRFKTIPPESQNLRDNLHDTLRAQNLQSLLEECKGLEVNCAGSAEYAQALQVIELHNGLLGATDVLVNATKALQARLHDVSLIAPLDTAMQGYISASGKQDAAVYVDATEAKGRHAQVRSAITNMVSATQELMNKLDEKEKGAALFSAIGSYTAFQAGDIEELTQANTAIERHNTTLSLLEIMEAKTEALGFNLALVSFGAAAQKAREDYLQSGGQESNEKAVENAEILELHKEFLGLIAEMAQLASNLASDIGNETLGAELREKIDGYEQNGDPNLPEYKEANRVHLLHKQAKDALKALKEASEQLKNSLEDTSLEAPLLDAMSQYRAVGLSEGDEVYKQATAVLDSHRIIRRIISEMIDFSGRLQSDIGNRELGANLKQRLEQYEQLGNPNLSEYKEGVRMHTLHGQATQAISDLKDAIDSSMANPLDASLVTLLENTMSSYVGIEGLTEGDTLYQKGVSVLAIYRSVRSALDALPAATQALQDNIGDTSLASALRDAMSKCTNLEPKASDASEYEAAQNVLNNHGLALPAIEGLRGAISSLKSSLDNVLFGRATQHGNVLLHLHRGFGFL